MLPPIPAHAPDSLHPGGDVGKFCAGQGPLRACINKLNVMRSRPLDLDPSHDLVEIDVSNYLDLTGLSPSIQVRQSS